jgi:hypothetical protein
VGVAVWPFPLWPDRSAAAAPCAAAACCAIATSATTTAVLHRQSRCDGRQTPSRLLWVVTLPDRPHCRCTALSGAPTILGCHPRQDPPPSRPPRQKCKRTYPISRFSRASSSALTASASRAVLSSVSTLSTAAGAVPPVFPSLLAPALMQSWGWLLMRMLRDGRLLRSCSQNCMHRGMRHSNPCRRG